MAWALLRYLMPHHTIRSSRLDSRYITRQESGVLCGSIKNQIALLKNYMVSVNIIEIERFVKENVNRAAGSNPANEGGESKILF
jgi:hypothetical protein